MNIYDKIRQHYKLLPFGIGKLLGIPDQLPPNADIRTSGISWSEDQILGLMELQVQALKSNILFSAILIQDVPLHQLVLVLGIAQDVVFHPVQLFRPENGSRVLLIGQNNRSAWFVDDNCQLQKASFPPAHEVADGIAIAKSDLAAIMATGNFDKSGCRTFTLRK